MTNSNAISASNLINGHKSKIIIVEHLLKVVMFAKLNEIERICQINEILLDHRN